MKEDLYNLLLKELDSFKVDLQFEPQLLNELDFNQRRVVEFKIYKLCLNGVISAYKYLPCLKYVNITDLFTKTNLNRYSDESKYSLCKYGYLTLKKDDILEYIYEASKHDDRAYAELVDLYLHTKENKILTLIKNYQSDERKAKFVDMIKKISHYENENKEEEFSRAVVNGIIGFAIGDALGVPVEFKPRNYFNNNKVDRMLEYGTHNQPKGTWSDDTSTTIAVMDSINECGDIDFNDIMKKFVNWYFKANYTATDTVFDIGIATSESISNYIKGVEATKCGPSGFRQNGNGSLMRMLPIVFYCIANNLPENQEVKLIDDFSSMTHGHEISKLGCKIFCDYIKEYLLTKSKDEAYKNILSKDYSKYYSYEAIEAYSRILDGNLPSISEDEISGSGFVVHSLEASLWCTLNSNSYEEAVLKAVNLGDDTDTVGAITGGINGIIYGLPSIKNEWKEDLKKVDYLFNLSEKFSNNILNKKKYEIGK